VQTIIFRVVVCETRRCLQARFFHKDLQTIEMLVKENLVKVQKVIL